MTNAELDHARNVPLASLRRYLLLNGWQRLQNIKRGFDLYRLPADDGQELELVVPHSLAEQDAIRWIRDALRSLSQLCDQDIASTAAMIRSVTVDIIRSRVPDSLVLNESIHLDVASEFIKNVKRLLSAAATTELAPAPFFGRVRKEAQLYAEGCRFGHTFRGSFGFTIESPIPQNDSPTIEVVDQIPPFERRVIERIARGLKTLELAANEQDTEPAVKNYRNGFSANMFDELIDIAESIKGERLKFEFAFSPEWRVSSDITPKVRFELMPVHVEVAKYAAKTLRLREFDRKKTIIGRVIGLKSKDNPSELVESTGDREVTILWISSEFGEISVRVQLPPEEYLQAVEAHKVGRMIRISGSIERIGRSWLLLEPHDFSLEL